MKIVKVNSNEINRAINDRRHEYVLDGLQKGGVGFIIAAPGVGKSHLALSIAYEQALGIDLIGLRTGKSPAKTLIWPSEDQLEGTIDRIDKHKFDFNEDALKVIEDNISIIDETVNLLEPSDNRTYYAKEKSDNIASLITVAKGFDLLILDTLRSITAGADAVHNDRVIGQMLWRIAKEANVAVLVMHHPTKAVVRGSDPVNSVSGDGLPWTLSRSKYLLFYSINKNQRQLVGIKCNYTKDDVRTDISRSENELSWKQGFDKSLLKTSLNIKKDSVRTIKPQGSNPIAKAQRNTTRNEDFSDLIKQKVISTANVSKSSQEAAEQKQVKSAHKGLFR